MFNGNRIEFARKNPRICSLFPLSATEDVEFLIPFHAAGVVLGRSVASKNGSLSLSHTIMYGEPLGEIRNGRRERMVSWFASALARGRALVPWRQDPPQGSLLGDSTTAFFYGFASRHSAGVLFAFGDGHAETSIGERCTACAGGQTLASNLKAFLFTSPGT
jgi:hypothetical protein